MKEAMYEKAENLVKMIRGFLKSKIFEISPLLLALC